MANLESMPTKLISYLRSIIEQTDGKEEADFAVYQLGREWGGNIVDSVGEKCGLDWT